MDFDTLFGTDQKAEEQGKWFNDVLGEGKEPNVGVDLCMRRATSRAATREKQRVLMANKRSAGKVSDEDVERMQAEIIAKSILVGWRGVKLDGADVPFSQEKALELLTKYPDFRRVCLAVADSPDAFRKEVVEDIEKNS